jgi:uncharacterized membrane protein
MPFATAWMGENHFAKNTVAVYALLASLCGVAYYILLLNIKRCNPDNDALLKMLKQQTRKGVLSNIFNTLAIPAAFIHPAISGILILIVYAMWLVPDRNIERTIKGD